VIVVCRQRYEDDDDDDDDDDVMVTRLLSDNLGMQYREDAIMDTMVSTWT
jgi:hypothetical protein